MRRRRRKASSIPITGTAVLADGREVDLAQLVTQGDEQVLVTTAGEVLALTEILELEDLASAEQASCWVCGAVMPAAELLGHTSNCEAEAWEMDKGR